MTARYTVREEWFGTNIALSCVRLDFDDIDEMRVYYLYPHNKGHICICPAGNSPLDCRHKRIVAAFMQYNKLSTGWWYEYDTNTWHKPLEY